MCVAEFDKSTAVAVFMFLHVTALIFSVLTIFAEIEYMPVFRHFDFLGNWFGRGVFYYFVGIMTYNSDRGGLTFSDEGFNRGASIAFVALGGFYIITAVLLDLAPHALKGLLGLQGIPNRNDYEL